MNRAERELLSHLKTLGVSAEFVRQRKHPMYKFTLGGESIVSTVSGSPTCRHFVKNATRTILKHLNEKKMNNTIKEDHVVEVFYYTYGQDAETQIGHFDDMEIAKQHMIKEAIRLGFEKQKGEGKNFRVYAENNIIFEMREMHIDDMVDCRPMD